MAVFLDQLGAAGLPSVKWREVQPQLRFLQPLPAVSVDEAFFCRRQLYTV